MSLATITHASAIRRLDLAALLLKDAAESGLPSLIDDAFREIMLAKGDLAAAEQLRELEAIRANKAERPAHLPPRLQVVGP